MAFSDRQEVVQLEVGAGDALMEMQTILRDGLFGALLGAAMEAFRRWWSRGWAWMLNEAVEFSGAANFNSFYCFLFFSFLILIWGCLVLLLGSWLREENVEVVFDGKLRYNNKPICNRYKISQTCRNLEG